MAHPTTVHPGLIKLASLLDYDATLDTNESSKGAGSNSMGEDASTRAHPRPLDDHTTQDDDEDAADSDADCNHGQGTIRRPALVMCPAIYLRPD